MKTYSFKKYDNLIYKIWILNKYFCSNINSNKKPYYLLLPPPNITGDLHIGHILNFTILDIYARIKRMQGYNVCWIPGTDHASIATEIKIRQLLKNKNINYISNNKFKLICLNWSKRYNQIIKDQLKRIGCSCDWHRFKFTMDKNHNKSVKKIFIKLYKKGLIYKSKKIVNWDVQAKTTISDEEVTYKKKNNYLYYIKYFTLDKKKYLTIATTRPETIFGDSAICINPNDSRYKEFINKKVVVPIVGRVIPIITDKLVDMNIGSGCLKITPAHSRKDFDIYIKHKDKIKIIDVFNEDGTLNKVCKRYKNLDRFLFRKIIIKKLKKLGYIINIKKKISNIAYSERTSTIIEKKISLQWYLKMKIFKLKALKLIKKINILPLKKYSVLLYKWINILKDWNISRQLVWGHRIPIYYYKNYTIPAYSFKQVIKILKKKLKILNIKKNQIHKDNNVLDTWFSSWILPISALNGININNNKDLKYYYPINLLVTGYDILFFWVLRMIMFSTFYIKKIPFKEIYFTGIIRDENNKKLSKSLGNYKNLYLLLNKYGADVLRVSVLDNNHIHDFVINDKKYITSRNFVNKVWNSYILINKIYNKKGINNKYKISLIIIKWFKNILNIYIKRINLLLKKKNIYYSFILIKKLFKKEFCSKFLEYIKIININILIKKKIINIYNTLLKLLHPYIPFITEYIWIKLKNESNITISIWPKTNIINNNKKINYTFDFILFIRKINFKKKNNYIYINNKYKKQIIKNIYLKLLYNLSNVKKIYFYSKLEIIKKEYKIYIYKRYKLYILYRDIIDSLDKNIIKNKIIFYSKYLLNIKKKLNNKNFLYNAPSNIIKIEKKKKNDILKKILLLKKKYLI
ncbi:MAG: valine--tRNA ligase [Candidatus Shikimatogenerans bostrichidophilus]|nr:MAG: valine--tRNA ligase [Candidatus Shikimatogenerans bostrichidophilus]